ncbi:phage DNA ejection protein [Serratia marcescens]|nr:phage DNA ejection protein [Serratia marcescens]
MATWQESNGGGLLAGIGRQNINAPQASDINTTLGLIRDNNDIARSGANNVALTGLRGLAGVADIYNQQKQQEAQNAFNQVQANAWASGDNSGLIKFAQENPAFVAQAQQAFSGLDEQKRNELGQLAMQTNTALAQGPEVYSKFVNDNSDRLKRLGADPNWMLQAGISSPEQLSHLTNVMTLGAVGPDKMLDYQDKQVGRQLEQGRLDESARQANMQNDTTIRGQNIAASNSAADRQIRLMQLRQDALVKQAANETNDLKRQELQLKVDANQQALQEKQQQKQMSLGYAAEAATLAREIAKDSSLGDITGSISSRIPTIQDSSQDLINKANRLQSLLTQDNLKMMSGVLTDRDITFLGNIASGLNITENGIKGSKDGVQKRLGAIAAKLDDKLSASGYTPQQQQAPDSTPAQQQGGGNFTSKSGITFTVK